MFGENLRERALHRNIYTQMGNRRHSLASFLLCYIFHDNRKTGCWELASATTDGFEIRPDRGMCILSLRAVAKHCGSRSQADVMVLEHKLERVLFASQLLRWN